MRSVTVLCLATFAATAVFASLLAGGGGEVGGGGAGYKDAPPPHIGNGFVAAFLNNSNEFVAGVFSGNTVHSTRAGLPATNTRFVASVQGGAPSQWWLHESTGTGRLGLFDANSKWIGDQVWLATRPPKAMPESAAWDYLGSTVTFVALAPDTESATLSWIVPSFDPTQYPLIKVVYQNSSNDVHVAVYQTTVPEEAPPISSEILIAVVWRVPPAQSTLRKSDNWAQSVLVSSRCTEYVISNASDQIERTIACARRRFNTIDTNPQTVVLEHLTAWSELWDGAITTTNANASSPLNQVITSSMYALYSSLNQHVPYSTSPGGLPTDGYNGHTFWDMETWMMPNLVLLDPELTKGSPIRYRLDRLEGAAVNAVDVVNGKEGYAFPWESAFTGYDVCPWPQGEHSEIHITADVVNGWRLYYDATGDMDFLRSAYVALVNTSHFWLSRSIYNATTQTFHINNVTPPDEYHFGDDSAYTNSAVRAAVNFTIRAAVLLGQTLDEASQLQNFVDNLFIPYNATGNYHPEFVGYAGDKVKQADVVLMSYPLGVPMDASTARNDLVYYAARTDPLGPAMTWSVFSISYMGLGDAANADKYFRQGYALNTIPPYYQWYEVAGGFGCPNFLTGAGGFLQSTWAGIGGVRVAESTLRVTTAAMLGVDGVETMTLHRIYFQGVPLRLDYESSSTGSVVVTITRLPAEDGSRKTTVSLRGYTGVEVLAFDVPLRRVGKPADFELVANGKRLAVAIPVRFDLANGDVVIFSNTTMTHAPRRTSF